MARESAPSVSRQVAVCLELAKQNDAWKVKKRMTTFDFE